LEEVKKTKTAKEDERKKRKSKKRFWVLIDLSASVPAAALQQA
jgi:hypothetical protein